MEDREKDEVLDKVKDLAAHVPYLRLHGIRVISATQEKVVISTRVRHEFTNPYGMAHGGLYFTLADCCSGLLCRTDGKMHVTMDADVHFLRSAFEGSCVTAAGEFVKKGRNINVVHVEVRDEKDTLLFDSVFTYSRISGSAGGKAPGGD